MVYSTLSFHNDIQGDLDVIREVDGEAFDRVVALFRQLRADPSLTEKLLDHGFGAGGDQAISISRWVSQWRDGVDLWRLKSWEMEQLGLKYRVIYLYLPQQTRFVVMAVVHRDRFNYDDPDHPLRKRIEASIERTYGGG